jgi:hypothetical protein
VDRFLSAFPFNQMLQKPRCQEHSRCVHPHRGGRRQASLLSRVGTPVGGSSFFFFFFFAIAVVGDPPWTDGV